MLQQLTVRVLPVKEFQVKSFHVYVRIIKLFHVQIEQQLLQTELQLIIVLLETTVLFQHKHNRPDRLHQQVHVLSVPQESQRNQTEVSVSPAVPLRLFQGGLQHLQCVARHLLQVEVQVLLEVEEEVQVAV